MNYVNIWYCITYKGQKGGGISSLGDIQSSAGQVPEQPSLAGLVLSRVLDQMTACGLFQPKLLCDLRIVLFLCVGSNTGQILHRRNTFLKILKSSVL